MSLKRLRKWCVIIALLALLICSGLWLADKVWPLPLSDVQVARVVVAEDGSPLWRFADGQGVWRYPVTIEQVSPYYLQALLTYEVVMIDHNAEGEYMITRCVPGEPLQTRIHAKRCRWWEPKSRGSI